VPTSLQLDDPLSSKFNRVNATMKFVTPTEAIIFDGYENVYFAELISEPTNDPLSKENWTTKFKFSTRHLEKFAQACILKDALLFQEEVHLLFVNVHETSSDSNSKYDTLINWLQFEKEASTEADVWSMKRIRRLNCFTSVPDYVFLEMNGQSVYVAGTDLIKYEFDSVI